MQDRASSAVVSLSYIVLTKRTYNETASAMALASSSHVRWPHLISKYPHANFRFYKNLRLLKEYAKSSLGLGPQKSKHASYILDATRGKTILNHPSLPAGLGDIFNASFSETSQCYICTYLLTLTTQFLSYQYKF